MADPVVVRVPEDEGATPPAKGTPPPGKEKGRAEAFSDGVMAIAITLLILEIKVPPADTPDLAHALAEEWPSFLALVSSFLTILIIWINHHRIFRLLGRVDAPFLMLNGVLLLAVTFIPYPTAVVATHITGPQATTAALLYAGTGLFVALAFNGMWRYAATKGRLISATAPPAEVATINREYLVGPLFYGIAVVLAVFAPLASLAVCALLAGFFAVTARL